ncbi:hypothetical protein [Flavobacterium pedocola]
MSKKLKIFLVFLIGVVLFIFGVIFYGLKMMAIEDRYGDFLELYNKIDASDEYFVIIDGKEVGFIEMLEDEIFLQEGDCLKHIMNYDNNVIEVYQFEPNQTYISFGLADAFKLKKEPSTKLIFKN